MNENRLAYIRTGYLKPDKFEFYKKQQQEFTFKPNINATSNLLANQEAQKFLEQNPLNKFQPENQPSPAKNLQDKSFSSMNSSQQQKIERYQMLYKKKEIIEKQKQVQRDMKKEEEIKKCTFKPNLIAQNKVLKNSSTSSDADFVNRLYKPNVYKKRMEEKKKAEEEKEILELNKCTFYPKVNLATSTLDSSNALKPKGFDETIGRIRYGYEEYQRKKQILEFVPKGENFEKIKKQKIKPFSFYERDKQQKKQVPFVYIDVNIGPGKTGRIGLHQDDDPKEVARNFAKTFQLNEEMRENLETLIENQINNYQNQQQENQNQEEEQEEGQDIQQQEQQEEYQENDGEEEQEEQQQQQQGEEEYEGDENQNEEQYDDQQYEQQEGEYDDQQYQEDYNQNQ